MNPFLPEEIKLGKKETLEEKRERFMKFNEALTQKLSSEVNQERSALNKLKEYWTYFSQNQGISQEDKQELFRCNEVESFNEKAKKNDLKNWISRDKKLKMQFFQKKASEIQKIILILHAR